MAKPIGFVSPHARPQKRNPDKKRNQMLMALVFIIDILLPPGGKE
jgi:hypothetical protein